MFRSFTSLILSASFLMVACSQETVIGLTDTTKESSDSFVVPSVSIDSNSTETGGEISAISAWIPRTTIEDDLGVHFEGESQEVLTWGPQNFTIDADGTFWISDTVTDHVLHTDRGGFIIETIDVSKDAVGAVMVDVNEDEMAVISVASQPPRALRYTRSGELVDTYDLPMEWQGSVTGIEISDEGSISVQREHGYRRYPLIEKADGSYALTEEAGITWDLKNPSAFDRFVAVPVDTRNRISLRRFMGKWDDVTYVYVEEWRDDEYGQAVVDATVRQFNEDTVQIGIARVNIRERYTFVDLDGVQYDPDTGEVLAMMTKVSGLEIVPLKFVDHLDVLPDWGKLDDGLDGENTDIPDVDNVPVSTAACVSGSTMISNISAMSINAYSGSLTDSYSVYSNSSGCTGRTVPRYLTGEAFFGVPYSWGDCDNDSTFDTYMDSASSTNNYKAGDSAYSETTLTSPTSCGRGTDCSGLITRAWGYSCPSGKLSTSSIASSTYASTDTGSWGQGEVYNKSGDHVAMYYGVYSGTTYYWYESTVYASYDRVVLSTHPSSYWSGYTHRRSVNHC